MIPKSKHKTVDEYIEAAPKEAQEKLREIREILKEVATYSIEAIKWGSPVFKAEHILFSYSAYKTHLNFMPTRSTLEQFTEELQKYTTGKDTVQFPYDKPLPKTLIQKLANYRVKEVKEGALWMHQD